LGILGKHVDIFDVISVFENNQLKENGYNTFFEYYIDNFLELQGFLISFIRGEKYVKTNIEKYLKIIRNYLEKNLNKLDINKWNIWSWIIRKLIGKKLKENSINLNNSNL
jgi:hypothetical protein